MSILSMGSNGSAVLAPGMGGQASPYNWQTGNSGVMPGLGGQPSVNPVTISASPAAPAFAPSGTPSYLAKRAYNSNPGNYGYDNGMSGGGGMATYDPTSIGNMMAGLGQMAGGNAALMNAYANMGGNLGGASWGSPYGMGFTYNAGAPLTANQQDSITAQYAAQQAANASMYGANQAANANMYGAHQGLLGTQAQANAAMYGANQGAGANMYGSQQAADAAKFGSQANLDAALAAAQANQNVASIGAGAQNYGNQLNAQNVQGTNATNLAMNQGNNATQLGLGQMGLQGQLGVSQNDLAASLANTQASLANTSSTNAANLAMNQGTNATNLGLGQLGLQGQLGTAQYGFMGQQAQAQAALDAAKAQAAAQQNIAQTTTAPALLKAQTLQNLLSGSGGGGLSGLGGGIGGVGGGIAGVSGGTGLGGQSQPNVPSFQPANAQNVLQNFNTLLAQDQQGNATDATGLAQDMGNRGFNNTSMAGGGFGLNTGGSIAGAEGNTLNQQALQQQADNMLKAQNLAYTNNANYGMQNAQMQLDQYNANQNRLAALLGLGVQSQGQILGALS